MEFRLHVSTLIERNGKILLVQEAKEQQFEKWNFPGGHLELGEKVVEAAKREVMEETFLDVEMKSFIGVYTSVKNNHSLRFLFSADAKDLEPKAGDQILACKWFDIEELKNLSEEKFVNAKLLEAGIQDYMSGKRFPLDVIQEVVR